MLTHTYSPKTFSEAAADGLLAGLVAGMGMALYLLAAAGLGGEAPLAALARFDVSGGASPLAGALAHLATAAVYGAAFGGLRRLIPFRRGDRRIGAVLGLVFGLALWGLALAVLLPASAPLRGLPPVHFGVAHVVYGVLLGGVVSRGETR